MPVYQDGLESHDLIEDIKGAVDFLQQNAPFVEYAQWLELKDSIGERYLDKEKVLEPVVYDANFSLAEELQSQIAAVRAVREKIMHKGKLVSDITTREAKEVISSGSTLLGTLMKYHEKVVNMERLRILEMSVVEALLEVDKDLRDRVIDIMEEKLLRVA